MVDVSEFIAHYASQYYDPAKAREYYLRTRELKGRRKTSELKTDEKKEAWGYAKNQITEAKKRELADASAGQKETVAVLREKAKQRREEISNSLKQLLEVISGNQTRQREALSDRKKKQLEEIEARVDSQIAAIPKIPRGVSKQVKARLQAERSAKIAKIRGDAEAEEDAIYASVKTDRVNISEAGKAFKAQARDSSRQDKEKVVSELKGSLDGARKNYDALKEKLKAKYEAAYDSEFNSIKDNF